MKKAYGSMARSETLTSEQDWNSLNLNDEQSNTAREVHRSHNCHQQHHRGSQNNAKNQNDSFRVAEDLNDEFEEEVSNLIRWFERPIGSD